MYEGHRSDALFSERKQLKIREQNVSGRNEGGEDLRKKMR
jgi:hypothetical protein